MNRITAFWLCVLLCISTAGCSGNSDEFGSSLSLVSSYEEEIQTETAECSETRKKSIIDDTSPETTAPDLAVETQTETSDISDIKPSEQSSGTENSPSEIFDSSTKPDTSAETKNSETTSCSSVTNIPTESTTTKENKATENSKSPETTNSGEITVPSETAEPEETKTSTETAKSEEPADPYAYPFNMEQIREDCISLGRSYGFILDESLNPNNSSWAGAETASAGTQGTRLKNLLYEMVEYYSPVYRKNMGLSAVNITAFNIYCESTGNGSYRVYFLFLL